MAFTPVDLLSRLVSPFRWWASAPSTLDDLGDALRTSEARYRGIVETQQATVMRLDFSGRIAFANEYCCQFVGATRADVIGQSYADWVHPDDREALVVALAALSRPPYRACGLSRVIAAGGAVRWLEWEGATILDAQGTPVELQSIGRDVTERLQVEERLRATLGELRASEERLRLLARRQVTIREEERKRLGFDLHDDVCQELVGIGILVEAVRCRLAAGDGEAASELERVMRYLHRLGDHVRVLATDLQPMLLRDHGLEGSLRSLAAGLSTDGTRIEVVIPAPVPRLDELAEVAVYRITQEALTNALRHAGSAAVAVVLDARYGRLRLEVRDGGCGFDASAGADGRRDHALGIVGMQERTLALGGRLEVDSAPGRGTTSSSSAPSSSDRPTRPSTEELHSVD